MITNGYGGMHAPIDCDAEPEIVYMGTHIPPPGAAKPQLRQNPPPIQSGVSNYNPNSNIIAGSKRRRHPNPKSRASSSVPNNPIVVDSDDDIQIVSPPRASSLSRTNVRRRVKQEPETIELDGSDEETKVEDDGRTAKRPRNLKASRNASTETLPTPGPSRITLAATLPNEQREYWEGNLDAVAPWAPVERNANLIEPTEPQAHIGPEPQFPISRRMRARFSSAFTSMTVPSTSRFHEPLIWDFLREECTTEERDRPPHSSNIKYPRGALPKVLSLDQLMRVDSVHECAGSVFSIQQRDGWVVAGGSATGGGSDLGPSEDAVVDIYNTPGSLITYNYSKPQARRARKQEGHQRVIRGEVKHYTVNCVQFHPDESSSMFLSSGQDRCVRICDRTENEYVRSSVLKKFDCVPHDMTFKPDSRRPVLAVGERDIYLFDKTSGNAEETLRVAITPSEHRIHHKIGVMRWGTGARSNVLFASTEPEGEDMGAPFTGFHAAVDVQAQRVVVKFDAKEAGDEMVIHPSGDSMILTTRASKTRNVLRYYDLRRLHRKAEITLDLELYNSEFEAEIHAAAFSPDGIYLALGRDDNETHVYDSRFLDESRGPLYRFCHSQEHKNSPQSRPCGIQQLKWLTGDSLTTSSRLGLVTGGSDGCVRLWDPLRADDDPDNGTVLAEVNSDISSFSWGDPFKKEHQLIVGDACGEITIFDRQGVCSSTLDRDFWGA